MAVEITDLQKQLAELKAENDKLRAFAQEKDVGEHKARADKAEADKAKADELLKKADEVIKAATAKTDEVSKERDALKTQVEETNKSLADVKEELSKLYTEQKKATRVATAKDKLGLTTEDATEFVENSAASTDEQFTKQIDAILKAKSEWTAKKPAKSTPAKEPGKSTPAKLPTAKAEDDADGEDSANETDLDGVESSDASLSVEEPDEAVSALGKEIASYFGCVEENAE